MKTLIRQSAASDLVYTVCSGLSVPILMVITVEFIFRPICQLVAQSGACPIVDQEALGTIPTRSGNILLWSVSGNIFYSHPLLSADSRWTVVSFW